MAELTPKEAQIARIAQTTQLANTFKESIIASGADLGMAVESALMIIRGVARQCPSNEMRCNLLDAMNAYIQEIAKMNHENHQTPRNSSDPEAPVLLQ